MAVNSEVTVYNNIFNYPSLSNKSAIRSATKSIYGFQYPIDPKTYGSYFTKARGVDLIKSNLRQMLMTNRGERVMHPDFGTNLRSYMMEQIDESLLHKIKIEVIESMARYARDVKLLKIRVIPNDSPNAYGDQTLTIKLYCRLKNVESVNFDLEVTL